MWSNKPSWTSVILASIFSVPISRAADAYVETVHAAVIFARHGEQTPFLSPEPSVLTPLGAQQLQIVGTQLRSRYIDTVDIVSGNSAILGLSKNQINNTQLFTLSGREQYISGSIQALFQGLYPPVNITTASSTLANGSFTISPMGGYQYPAIATASSLDPNRIWVTGDALCPIYLSSGAEYFQTSDFSSTRTETQGLYDSLRKLVEKTDIDPASLAYFNAFEVYDYFSYQHAHNRTLSTELSAADLAQLQTLADQSEFTLNGNLTASGLINGDRIRTVAGRTLATRITSLLRDNILSKGSVRKLSIMSGSHEPFLAFFALARLPNINSDFQGIPSHGSSMTFELYSVGNTTTYPSDADLRVRFLFQNGTSDAKGLRAYPIFGRGPSQTEMTWADFSSEMQNIQFLNVGEWCHACGSQAYFCGLYDSIGNPVGTPAGTGSNASPSRSPSSKISPATGGVIGAAVTVIAVLLALLAAIFLGGIRFHRRPPKWQKKRVTISANNKRGIKGGFKGDEKMASDADLTLKDGAVLPAGVGAFVIADHERGHDAGNAHGHERTGSWELKEHHSATEASTAGTLANKGRTASIGSSIGPDGSAHPGRRVDEQAHGEHYDEERIDPFQDPVWVEDRV